MNSYRHAGDLGDIIYSLPVVRCLGAGIFYIEQAKYTRQLLTPDKWCGIDLLLKQQPYIVDVQVWNGQRVSTNLNDFRARMIRSLRIGIGRDTALVDWFLQTHGLPQRERDTSWLTVEPNRIARVVFNRAGAGRSPQNVYQNPDFPWHYVWEKYGKEAVFIGSELEYDTFCGTCGRVNYYGTKDLLEAAKVIAGAELFVGNQSVCHAIAEGLKKRIVLEVWKGGPNCLHFRDGVVHGWNGSVVLPDL